MKKNIILIDLENVQSAELDKLKDYDFKVYVFVGANQNKINFELASGMQKLANQAEYIKINGNGNNALDFHIAYYIGTISTQEKDVFFHIISKDKGFDPLISHLKSKKILILRHESILQIPILQDEKSKTKADKINAIISHLKSRGNARPRTIKTLTNSINSLLQRKSDEAEILELIKELIKKKVVIDTEGKVTYQL